MGLFSKKRLPSIAEQEAKAKAFVDSFLGGLYSNFNKEGSGSFTTKNFRIAGITHHCTTGDAGMISGITCPEENNQYDKNAIALVAIKGNSISKMYGYIEKGKQDAYQSFANGIKCMPFLGYIRAYNDWDGSKGLMGVVRIYRGNCAEMYVKMKQDAQLLEGAFKGYYGDKTLEALGEELEYFLKDHFK